jgi:hypothetical protein
MKTVKEREWKEKFIELPISLRIIVAWVYLISIFYFLKFLFALLFQLSLAVFDLAFGYLIWGLAGGLVNRSNLARIIVLVCFGFITASAVYVLWHGGTVSFDDLTLTFLYPGSIIWIMVSGSSTLILLLPQIRKLFLNSTQEEKNQ